MFELGQSIVIETAAGSSRHRVRGARKRTFLMVDQEQPLDRLVLGDTVNGLLLTDGVARKFVIRYLGALTEMRLAVFTYPESVVEQPMEGGERYPLNSPATLTLSGNPEPLPVALLDISRGGIRFSTADPVTPDQTFLLDASLGEEMDLVEAPVTTVRVGETAGGFVAGAMFRDLGEENRAGLDRFLLLLEKVAPALSLNRLSSGVGNLFPLSVRCQLIIGRTTYESAFRGQVANHALLTDLPADEKGNVALADRHAELDAVIRYLYDGVAYRFDTRLLRQYTTPATVWAWEYPMRTDHQVLRHEERVRTFAMARLTDTAGERSATLLDLSADGALVTVGGDKAPGVGSRVRLSLRLSENRPVEGLACETRRVRKIGDQTLLGLVFADKQGEPYRSMTSYLHTLQRLASVD